MDSRRLTPQGKDDFAPGEAPAPHRRAKSCSAWSSGQVGRGAKLDSASRQAEHFLHYNGSGWLRNPYSVYLAPRPIVDFLLGLKAGDSYCAASRHASVGSCFTGLSHHWWSYLASTGVLPLLPSICEDILHGIDVT